MSGIRISTMSGPGSRRSTRSSLRLMAKLRRSDIDLLVRVVAATGEREEDAVEARSQEFDAAQSLRVRAQMRDGGSRGARGIRRGDAQHAAGGIDGATVQVGTRWGIAVEGEFRSRDA